MMKYFFLLLALFALTQATTGESQLTNDDNSVVEDTRYCAPCKLVVNAAEKWLNQVEIEHFIEKLCPVLSMIPEKECDALIETYVPVIIRWIDQKETPEVLCAQFHLCPPVTVSKVDECGLCKVVLKASEEYLAKNRTEVEIEDFLQKLCSVLPMDKTECGDIIMTYVPVLVNWAETKYPPEVVCQMTGFCKKEVHEPTTPIEPVGKAECTLCKQVLTWAEKFLDNNSTVEKIESVIEKDICPILPISAALCNSMVEKYTPLIIVMLDKNYPPEKICEMFHLCEPEVIEPVNESGECVLCKTVLKFAEKELNNNHSIAEIEKFLEDNVCPTLPIPTGLCDKMVVKYTPIIVEMLEKKLDPETVCISFKMCKPEEKPMPKPLGGQGECVLCKTILEWAEKELKDSNNVTEATVKKFLDEKVCPSLPIPESLCESLVANYIPMIIQMLEEKIDPDTMCAQWGFCDKKVVEPVQNDGECSLCTWVMNLVEEKLANNVTEAEIEAFIEKNICNALPVPEKICDSIVEKYLPAIIVKLEAKYPPQVACAAFHLCPAPETIPSNDMCSVCVTMVDGVENWIASNSTMNVIENFIEGICSFIPFGSEYCDSLIEKWTPVVVEWVIDNADGQTLCAAIDICAAPAAVEPVKSEYCGLCKIVIKFAEKFLFKYLEKEDTEKAVEHFLEDVCHIIGLNPDSCDAVVEQYYATVLHWLETKATPEEACHATGLCMAPPKMRMESNGVICSGCEWAVEYAENWITKDNHTAIIEHFIEEACPVIPIDGDTCVDFIEKFVPEILEYIFGKETPEVFCSFLGACDAALSITEAEECKFCTILSKAAERWLSKDSTEAEVEHFVSKMCKYLPTKLQAQCGAVVEQYTPMVMQYIEGKISSDQICSHVC